MQENLKDILSNLSTEVDQETLLLYLQGQLSAEQQHEVEKKMMDNEFASDALEGLQNFKDQQRLQLLVDQLKKDIRKKTEKKKLRREKMRIKNQPWLYISILILMILLILAFIVIYRLINTE